MNINLPDNYKLYAREFSVSPVEFYRIQLGFILPTLNNTKLTILAYIANWGYREGRKKILEDQIVTSPNSLANFITELRTLGYVVGYKEDIKLVDEIDLCHEDNVTILTLKKDETKDEVGHRYFKVN